MSNTITNARTVPQDQLDNIESFGGTDAVFSGVFASASPAASLRLEGELHGSILFSQGGIVHISETAKVIDGSIEADYVFIAGAVTGRIHARKAVEIAVTAVVRGTVEYDGELDIHKNARIRAKVEFSGEMVDEAMSDVSATPPKPAPSMQQVVSLGAFTSAPRLASGASAAELSSLPPTHNSIDVSTEGSPASLGAYTTAPRLATGASASELNILPLAQDSTSSEAESTDGAGAADHETASIAYCG